MSEPQTARRLVRFGAFEADVQSGELRKDGVKLKFSGQPFQVLAILLERPGEVVTREELQKRLWPDTFVDVERNLNTAVNKIREVLGDSAESPRFVETVPRRGYRFIGAVEAPIQPATAAVTGEPLGVPRRGRRWLTIGAGVIAVAVIALAAFVGYRWRRQQRPQEQAVLTPVPFTALHGVASNPAFSPDGSRIAFAWSSQPGVNGYGQADLYLKALGSETLLRLTQHPSTTLIPAWSPDGTQIAFYREAGADSGIYVVPALGGPEQKLHSTKDVWNSAISWSPDGKWIAFEDMSKGENHVRIYLLSPETLSIRRISINPACVDEHLPAFSHNGRFLAYWCFRNNYQAALYFLAVLDGEPKVITSFWEAMPSGLTWSADDTTLIYSRSKNYSPEELVEVSVANGSAKQLGLVGARPAVSPKNDKLAYGPSSDSSNIWRRDLLHSDSPPIQLIPSSRAQYDARYSPDGKRIAFASNRSGIQAVWISNEDGSNLVQISDPNHVSGSPQWSPDGSKIAFDSFPRDHWEIYVADVAERKPRKLITNISSLIRPNWSRDGKWIYFASEERGREGVYRCPASGGDATALANEMGWEFQETSDGKALYFASEDNENSGLKRVALSTSSGAEPKIDPTLHVRDSRDWLLTPGGLYFVPSEAPRSVRYYDFATGHIRTIFEADRDLNSSLSVSPDGRWLLYSQAGDASGDIMLVDQFH
jgi:Tol biopolymer transport system component/DNA-binding winged helix-turn-helix (wHTH) protein